MKLVCPDVLKQFFAASTLCAVTLSATAVGLAELGLVDAGQASIEQYVTQKSLDGLYTIIAEEEKAIRKDPIGAASSIVQKVFGAIK